jgi:tetratricopeptide (TPR) repeat protein
VRALPGLVLAVLALQQPEVSVTVDRTVVAPGDTVVVTITVTARGNDPLRIGGPDLVGLELLDQRERSRVEMVEGVARRLTVRTLTLRVTGTGHARVQGLRVAHAGQVVEAEPVTIVVASATEAGASLEPALLGLVDQRAPPEGTDAVVVRVVASRDSVVVGEQVDVVAVAWFPRELRSRLRAPPQFEGPETRGVWAYRSAAPAGVALSRQVGGRWYDAFIQHQALFPLQAGALRLGPASVTYAVPVTYAFLSRELRHVVQSDSLVLAVRAYPAAGQPPGFRGASGTSLALRADPPRLDLEVGEARTLTVTLEGQGNVALWPEPELLWPQGVRAYPGEARTQTRRTGGAIAGSKRFEYLVVADSAGVYRVRSTGYPYYDLAGKRYVQLAWMPLEIVARPGRGLAVLHPDPPPLLQGGASWVPAASRLPPMVWVAAALLPLAVLGLGRLRFESARPAGAPPGRSRLERLDRHFRRAVERLVPDPEGREDGALADALRAAGVELSLANHVARVRDRLQRALYGPAGSGDPDELAAEVEEVLRALVGEPGGSKRPGVFNRVAVLALWVLVPAGLEAQVASAERLYEAGAFRAAADSFAARASRQPEVAAHWYNLGNAWYRLGSNGRAAAAWHRAARLAPRNPLVRRARSLVPPPDRFSERVLSVGALTPDEALGLGLAVWVAASVALAWGRARRWAVAALIGAALSLGYGWRLGERYRRPGAIAVALETPLREAPYGSAPAVRRLPEGAAVMIELVRPGWYLVSHAGHRGWVRTAEVVVW